MTKYTILESNNIEIIRNNGGQTKMVEIDDLNKVELSLYLFDNIGLDEIEILRQIRR